MEISAIIVTENAVIKGICISEAEHNISQFADDTQLMNNGNEVSFEKSLVTIENYGKVCSLFFDRDKTQAIWLGSNRMLRIKYIPRLKLFEILVNLRHNGGGLHKI